MYQDSIVKVGPENLEKCGIGCIRDRNHPGYAQKVDWLQKCFGEGLRILLSRDEKANPLGFLEYVPGEFAWRPVDAQGWLLIHCLWVVSASQRHSGLGSRLIRACVEKAERDSSTGVAAIVSNGLWMAGEKIFLNSGFKKVAQCDRFGLVIYPVKKGPEPRFREIGRNARKFRGLHIVYSNQCPMLSKSATDISEMAAEHGLKLRITVLKNAQEAQNAPSYYGSFNLLWNGRLLSDHYVSKGHFRNLLRNEIGRE